MDYNVEQFCFWVHHRAVTTVNELIPRNVQLIGRYFSLLHFTIGLIILFSLHYSFVGRNDCLYEAFQLAKNDTMKNNITGDFHILQININGFWTKLYNEIQESQKTHEFDFSNFLIKSTLNKNNGLLLSSFVEDYLRLDFINQYFWREGVHYYITDDQCKYKSAFNPVCEVDSQESKQMERNWEKYIDNSSSELGMVRMLLSSDPTYLFSKEKGYLLINKNLRSSHNIQTYNISIDAESECFGPLPLNLLIQSVIGFDTVILNNLISTYGHKGYLYNKQTQELWSLQYFGTYEDYDLDYIFFKLGAILWGLFMYLVLSVLVALNTRQIQAHTIILFSQLRGYNRHNLSVAQLIFSNAFSSLVLVLLTNGILLIIAEFLDDLTLAFFLYCLYFWCEFFSLISLRTMQSLKYFPRFVCLYFLLYFVYVAVYPHGFHYFALFVLTLGVEALTSYFFFTFEVPGVIDGRITIEHPRDMNLDVQRFTIFRRRARIVR
eukprot:TRINITY_DN3537_c0_g1_i1.p1 TRINITY_DN3537_c0_g1~~TRINITY_DN3537_c0_g1_i1.p1  ORF type:complete len:492 (-),score=23.87 TRINITY_DN3537_c0_g1_i1:111-1586(-)